MADTPWVAGPYHTAPWSDGSSAPGTLNVLSEAAQTVIAKDLPEAEAKLFAAAPEIAEALAALLRRDEINTCQHEETHRGGFLWEICDQCGAKWADDEGGKPEWVDPPEWKAARDALAKALGEQ